VDLAGKTAPWQCTQQFDIPWLIRSGQRHRAARARHRTVKTVMHALAVGGWTVIAETKGAALENLLLQHPFYERQVPVFVAIM